MQNDKIIAAIETLREVCISYKQCGQCPLRNRGTFSLNTNSKCMLMGIDIDPAFVLQGITQELSN